MTRRHDDEINETFERRDYELDEHKITHMHCIAGLEQPRGRTG